MRRFSIVFVLLFIAGPLAAQDGLEYPDSRDHANPAPRVVAMQGPRTYRPETKFNLEPSFSQKLPYVQTSGVVVCQADFPLGRMDNIMKDVDGLQRDLTKYLAIPAAKEKIELCLFGSEASYIDFIKKEYPDAPLDRRALYVKKKGAGVLMVQTGKNLEIDLRHEMTHAILHASLKEVPIWLDEGLAKYFELPAAERMFENAYLKKIRWNTQFSMIPNLSRLEKLRTINEMGDREYRDSWAWTHFMIHRSPATHRLLAEYLQTLADPGITPDTTPQLEPLVGKTVKDPKKAFVDHFQSWTPKE